MLQGWSRMAPNGLVSAYLQLSKHKLTMLITSTAVSGFLVSPAHITLPVLGSCIVGTALVSASANACNHILEAPYDAQMRRTQSRVLVVHRFSPLHAFIFANITAAAGLGILCVGCNSITASLGLLNLAIYAGVYTPMKRRTVACTWAGAVVGAIPPLMGYCAGTGELDAAALVLAAILFSWQFPHFNALSWNLRGDYSRAGYRIMCVTDPALCRRTTLRHSLILLALCSGLAPLSNLTTYTFALDTIPLNAAMIYLAYRFYRQPDETNSKQLFRFSLLYLPLIMLLAIISNAASSKRGTGPPGSSQHRHYTIIPAPERRIKKRSAVDDEST